MRIKLLVFLFVTFSISLKSQNGIYPDVLKSLSPDLKYRCVGPSRGGRVTTVTGDAKNPGTFYFGGTGGGVWKTTDYGQQWMNVSDHYFETGSIGALTVAPSDPNIIYCGTGSDGLRSNVIIGKGVYVSKDAGKSWVQRGLKNTGQTGAIIVHPNNPDKAYLAAIGNPFGPGPDRGVYYTTNGGRNWEKVFYISDRTGICDLEFAPGHPEIIYACAWTAERKPWTILSGSKEGGLYRSMDGGKTWRKLKNGLPKGVVGKSDLAVSPDEPARVYALIEAEKGQGGVYRSDDYGDHWQLVSSYSPILDRPFYYCNLDAAPHNAEILYANATGFYVSENAGKSWQRKRTPHGDNHDIWINPEKPEEMIQANDGGANVSRDGGKTWSTQYNQNTAELYQVNIDDQYPYYLYAGQQDNSTIMLPSFPPYSPSAGYQSFWRSVGGCETGPAVPKPGNSDIVYSNCKGRFGRYNKKTGQEKNFNVGGQNMYGHNPGDLIYRFQRVSPILVSPHNPDIVYHCSQFVHRSFDEGENWETISPDLTAFEADKQQISGGPITRDITGEEFYSTIYAISESPVKKGLIYTGSNDGEVYVSKDDGESWNNITPVEIKGGRVQTIETSVHAEGKVYVCAYRYLLNDWKPYLYRSNDYGASWDLLSNGENGIAADCPVRVVREDPIREGLLFAGTESGVFISFDDGDQWVPFQLNLPIVPVTDMKIHDDDLILSTMGRSFWILDQINLLRMVQPENRKPMLSTPAVSYRTRYRSYKRNSWDPEYTAPGLYVDFYLPEDQKKNLKIEILNDQGDLVRFFSNSSEKNLDDFDHYKGIAWRGVGTSILSGRKGFHRLHWDMRAPGYWSANSRRFGRGPMVLPGTYTLRFFWGTDSLSTEFEIRLDPRVKDDGVTMEDLSAQMELSLKVRDLMSEANHLAQMLDFEMKALKKYQIKRKRELEAIDKLLNTEKGRYPQPMLLSQISYLYGMLDAADQKPGNYAYIRYEQLKKEFAEVKAEFQAIH